MGRRIGLAGLYADAPHQVRAGADDAGEPRSLPEARAFPPDELLAGRPDVAALAARLGGSSLFRDAHSEATP
jgi:hypothetical protein